MIDKKKLQAGDFIRAEAGASTTVSGLPDGLYMRPAPRRQETQYYSLRSETPVDLLGCIGAFASVRISQRQSEEK